MFKYVSDCVACGLPDCTGCPRAKMHKEAVCDNCKEVVPKMIYNEGGRFLCERCARQAALRLLADLDIEGLISAVNDYTYEYMEALDVEDYLSEDEGSPQ